MVHGIDYKQSKRSKKLIQQNIIDTLVYWNYSIIKALKYCCVLCVPNSTEWKLGH